jgi:putative ABC transport system substrate-binding protein
MRRRDLIAGLGGAAAAWPAMAWAQQPGKVLRIGTVSGQPRLSPLWMAFDRRIAELGYQEGRNLATECIEAPSVEGFESGYRELANRQVDILVASGPEIALKSALSVTTTLPIVMIAIDYDPLARGYVTSLARPAGNVTGLYLRQIELVVKRLQVVKDAFPNMRTATVLWDRISADQWDAAQSSAAKLGLYLTGIELREQPYDYKQALAQVPVETRGILFVLASPFFFRDRAKLGEIALRNRSMSMTFFREMVEAGALMSYGPSVTGMYRRAAEYVDRIARGAKPGDLPIEQPANFEFVLNLKTAKAIGLDIPTAILLRADEVIE